MRCVDACGGGYFSCGFDIVLICSVLIVLVLLFWEWRGLFLWV